jgi:hypothetical protein
MLGNLAGGGNLTFVALGLSTVTVSSVKVIIFSIFCSLLASSHSLSSPWRLEGYHGELDDRDNI